jgi:hypothetical protein
MQNRIANRLRERGRFSWEEMLFAFSITFLAWVVIAS